MQCINQNCRCDLCSSCGVLWHINMSCEEYQMEIKSKTSGADEEFNKLTKLKKWCKCPNCGLVVERTEGCYHMTHYGCPGGGIQRRTDFCYFCGELLMKKNGEGWRFSKNTETKHFENGVYSECINVNADNGDIDANNNPNNSSNNSDNEDNSDNVDLIVNMHRNEMDDDMADLEAILNEDHDAYL